MFTPEEQEMFDGLPPEDQAVLLWHLRRRPAQTPPDPLPLIWLIRAGRAAGKLLALDTPIPTPDGFVRIGDLSVGDLVFDEAGRQCNVTAVFDEIPERAWRLRFSDGTTLVAGGEHQWVTWTHAERKALLRSPYEDVTRFPEDWPQWRLRRLAGNANVLPEPVVRTALRMSDEGMSVREIGRRLGVCRAALRRHLKAKRYLPPQPVVYPDSPGPKIRTTDEIAASLTFGQRGDTNHCIPLAGPLQTVKVALPIDPWLLGFWLGDGDTKSPTLTVGEQDVDWLRERLSKLEFTEKRDERNGVWRLYVKEGLFRALRLSGLFGNKHVPHEYLWGAEEDRLSLLRGLMDSDGSANPARNNVEFVSTKESLALAVLQLARSLGEKPVFKKGVAKLNGVECGPKFRVTWRPRHHVPFSLPRKAEKISSVAQGLRNHHRMIVGCDPVPIQPMRCITVDSPNAMYLAGEQMVPTHNTRAASEWVFEWCMKLAYSPDCPPDRIIRVALVGKAFDDIWNVMVTGSSGLRSVVPRSLETGVFRTYREYRWSFTNGAEVHCFGYTSEAAQKLRGPEHHLCWVDEPAKFVDAETDPMAPDNTFSNLWAGLRKGTRPHLIVTGTPTPCRLVKFLDQNEECVTTNMSTFDNAENLPADMVAEWRKIDPNSRFARQELFGEIIWEAPDALFPGHLIDQDRVDGLRVVVPDGLNEVLGYDPSLSLNAERDEAGIVLVGYVPERSEGGVLIDSTRAYPLVDLSGHYSPAEQTEKVISTILHRRVATLVVEQNAGVGFVITQLEQTISVQSDSYTLRKLSPKKTPYGPIQRWRVSTKGPNHQFEIRAVHARVGKELRAQSAAISLELHQVHFPLEGLERLEEQLTTWSPGQKSPDRMDAFVYALLMIFETGAQKTGPSRLIGPTVVQISSDPSYDRAMAIARLSTLVPSGHSSIWSVDVIPKH